MTKKKQLQKKSTWDRLFKQASLTDIPFPSKLSQELYDKLKKLFPKSTSFLEAGSGTGEISAYLAKKGHSVYLLDKSKTALELSKQFFKHHNVNGSFTYGDLFSIPYPNDTFDCVWNSGVLEHFNEKRIVQALKEMERVSKDIIIVLVPSAQSVPYRIAKWKHEDKKSWSYGHEFPKYTLQPYFEKANIHVLSEEFVGIYHGITWLREIFPIPAEDLTKLCAWVETLKEDRLKSGISYLLMTIGTKKSVISKENSSKKMTKILLEKDNQIVALQEKISIAEKKLHIMEHSRFWKVYLFLRKLKYSFFK